jgi:hypothetical protein
MQLSLVLFIPTGIEDELVDFVHDQGGDDEAGREAHLNGEVAAALMERVKAGDLFAKTPEIHKIGTLADKLPK